MRTDDFDPENIASTAFFTGHRVLPGDEIPGISDRLFQCLLQAYNKGYSRFLCGCALGFDTIAACQTIRLRERYPDVILSLAIPCAGQSDRWPEKDRVIYRRIISLADEAVVLSPDYYQGVMMERNRYMADRSSLCICYLAHMRGGTASAVRYALKHDRIKIVNIAVIGENESIF